MRSLLAALLPLALLGSGCSLPVGALERSPFGQYDQMTLPDVTGQDGLRAAQRLVADGFELALHPTTTGDYGIVTNQLPKPGTKLAIGDQIDLIISGDEKLINTIIAQLEPPVGEDEVPEEDEAQILETIRQRLNDHYDLDPQAVKDLKIPEIEGRDAYTYPTPKTKPADKAKAETPEAEAEAPQSGTPKPDQPGTPVADQPGGTGGDPDGHVSQGEPPALPTGADASSGPQRLTTPPAGGGAAMTPMMAMAEPYGDQADQDHQAGQLPALGGDVALGGPTQVEVGPWRLTMPGATTTYSTQVDGMAVQGVATRDGAGKTIAMGCVAIPGANGQSLAAGMVDQLLLAAPHRYGAPERSGRYTMAAMPAVSTVYSHATGPTRVITWYGYGYLCDLSVPMDDHGRSEQVLQPLVASLRVK